MTDASTNTDGRTPRKCTICHGHGYLVSDTLSTAEPVGCWRCGGSGHV